MRTMAVTLTALSPQEVVVLAVALAGLVPVLIYARSVSRWLLAAYGFLLVGALMTNLENLLWPTTLNLIEHSVGNLGVGVAFAVLAYVHRRRIHGTVSEIPTREA